jgi:xylulokinase
MTLLVGLDVGTTGARAVAVDLSGDVIAQAASDYPLVTPRPGWTEQDPEAWWQASREVLARVAAEAGGRVAGLGVTGQMHGAVFLDAAGVVVRPALLWNDQRTERQCREITERVGAERLLELAGNPALTGFQAPKILWLREEEPSAYGRVARVLLPKDYIRLRLTGEYATDASDASGTLLLDLARRNWSDEILARLEIERAWMPTVLESPEPSGQIRSAAADDTGLRPGLPVAAGAGDNAAAAVGTGLMHEGLASSSIGTSGVLFSPTDGLRRDPVGRVHAFCHAVPNGYHLMGVTLSAGGSLRWWHDVLGRRHDYEELTALAAQAPPGSEGLLFLPYLTGERTPHLDPSARGAFVGLSGRHTVAHLTRAIMEGVAFSLRDCAEAIAAAGAAPRQIRATGGGARSAVWRQIQADVYGLPVHRTHWDEGPAYGAALLGGVAAGVFGNVEESARLVRLRTDVTEPNPADAGLYDDCYRSYSALYPATRAVMHRLAALARATAGEA